ncbi:MAG TPA: Lrp/AsnC family transcriptional regulator, partial [Candidatus Bathyarchaeota archaeon]|nr:Lrp/AsnC family transcriptional regulator [Candidatus Bathyarchaeota archaeon]HEX69512.1 Lrp/AsnC family transcriptional regulator [Candidatus Bathyarchaeota archaeon]
MLKDVYKRLLLEMIANCKRSDRELARALGVSQPTVTRARGWLEKNGFVREYTVIPEFSKIGLEIVAFTFIKIRPETKMEKVEEIRSRGKAFFEKHPNIVMALRGEGFSSDGIVVSLHRDYAEFVQFMRDLKMETVNTDVMGSFLASLKYVYQYRH